MRVRTLVLTTMAAAIAVFAVVQDRATASGAREYVALQRQARTDGAPAPTIDEVMAPANARSVRQGLVWGGAALALGLGLAAVISRRRDDASDRLS